MSGQLRAVAGSHRALDVAVAPPTRHRSDLPAGRRCRRARATSPSTCRARCTSRCRRSSASAGSSTPGSGSRRAAPTPSARRWNGSAPSARTPRSRRPPPPARLVTRRPSLDVTGNVLRADVRRDVRTVRSGPWICGTRPKQDAFRAEARAWLEANVPPQPLPSFDTEEGFALHREWERTLSEGRWSAVSWPEEYGGRGADYIHWLIFEEEYYRAGAPGRVNQNGIFLLGPTIMEVGTDEQKARFLPTMASSEIVWAQAWSEPNAGSDLAAIRSTGVLTDDGDRVGAQRPEDLGVARGLGRLVLRHLPHRPRGRAPPWPHLRARAARLARRHRAADRAARRRHRLRRDLLRRRARAGREHARRGEPGVAGRDGHRRASSAA